ncbi:MAG: SUMF1/EgtB/PvdO family nonheme iron enzyme, partial [Planctomycetota bacterium]|nr:SUMF1/EgtB/PvdO family nonheme iron enzyme [Planctomycetota bacterium]
GKPPLRGFQDHLKRGFELLMAPGSWRLLGALLLLLGSSLRSEEIIHFELAEENAATRLAGAARFTAGSGAHVFLTDGTPHSLGAVWAAAPVPAAGTRVLVHIEYSLTVPGPMPEVGTLGGGLQLIFTGAGQDLALEGGDSLGSGSGAPYLGIALDLGGDGELGPAGPHLELNRDSNPAREPSLATSEDLPDVLSTGLTGGTLRLTAILESSRLRVIATSEHDCYGSRLLFDEPVSLPHPGGLRIGVAATSTETAALHRIHALDIRRENPRPSFLRGDCNQDVKVCGSVGDLVAIVERCFLNGPPLPCEAACDANGDGRVCGSVTDVVYLANYCFLGNGPPPPQPWPGCAAAEESSPAGCESPAACGDEPPGALAWLGRNDSGYPEYFRLSDEMVMVEVPAGSFEQGDTFFDFGGDELPTHQVSITEPFLLAKFEVSNRQYRLFLDAIGCDGPACAGCSDRYGYTGPGAEAFDGCHYPEGEAGLFWARNDAYFNHPDFADYPVTWVDWFDAVAYSRWANRESSTDWGDFRSYGLPTESQWEYAARWRGSENVPGRYPWGGSEGRFNSPGNINSRHCNHADPLGRTDRVCSYPAGRSWFGLYNQAGNVYEWTSDWYEADAYSQARENDPFTATGSVFRQLRGGGWFGPPFSVRSAYRCNFRPQDGDADIGFRPSAPAP